MSAPYVTPHDRGPWITTSTGHQFHVFDPTEDEVRIEDIAHALSLQCRFTGHVREFYSVAQHCVTVSHLCHEQDALYGLLHDASEAYIGDMSAPLKHTDLMGTYRRVETAIMRIICRRFGLPDQEPLSVLVADRRLLLTEARDLGMNVTGWYREFEAFDHVHVDPWPSKVAEMAFLERFDKLQALHPATVAGLVAQ